LRPIEETHWETLIFVGLARIHARDNVRVELQQADKVHGTSAHVVVEKNEIGAIRLKKIPNEKVPCVVNVTVADQKRHIVVDLRVRERNLRPEQKHHTLNLGLIARRNSEKSALRGSSAEPLEV
jgi:ribosome biogenesis SPOUT family RNA methylase Rps3